MALRKPIVAVVYDSASRGVAELAGRTEQVALSLGRGAECAGGASRLLRVPLRPADWDVLDGADVIVFGAPTYMGSVSAALKTFMEESLGRFLGRVWQDKLAAGFTNSAAMSGDKLSTLSQLAVFAAQHGMLWVSLGQLGGWNTTAGAPEDLNRLGSFLGLMAQSNADQGPAEAPPMADRATAFEFGKRIATLAARWTDPA
jgi:NAD(P)H dehydrogenase (quinone)